LHRICKVLLILFSNIALSSALQQAFWCKSNKINNAKIYKNVEMHTAQNYKLNKTKQVAYTSVANTVVQQCDSDSLKVEKSA